MYVKNPMHVLNHRRLEEDTILYIPALEERGMVAEVHQGNGPFWNPILHVEIFSTFQPEKGKRITYPSLLDACSYAPTYFIHFITLAEKLWHVHLFSQRVLHCVKELSAVMLTVTSVIAAMLLALNTERFHRLERRKVKPNESDGDGDNDSSKDEEDDSDGDGDDDSSKDEGDDGDGDGADDRSKSEDDQNKKVLEENDDADSEKEEEEEAGKNDDPGCCQQQSLAVHPGL
jgi:hypothetical protein